MVRKITFGAIRQVNESNTELAELCLQAQLTELRGCDMHHWIVERVNA